VGAGWNDFESARIALAKLELSPGDGSLERVLADATRISASALSVERVGVWVVEDDGLQLRCIWQHDAQSARENIPVLRAVDYPVYVRALQQHRCIAADDVRSHPHTRALAADYLEPLGITSMLDAPVYRGGEVIGIVCHEHTGPLRHWTDAERDMAATVADVIALVCEQQRRLGLEQELAETRAKLRELSLLDGVARNVAVTAHDLNNLLTMIIGSAALCEAQAEKPELVRSTARDIGEVGARAAVLVRRLLGLRRAPDAATAKVDLVALARRLAPVLRALLGAEHHLVLREPENAEISVIGDALGLEQALVNLVTNARQASAAASVVQLSVGLAERQLEGQRQQLALLEVRDTGVGMSDEVRRSALRPFFTTRSDFGGSGFGLHIVESVARSAGGFVEIESAAGRGTAVRILLPRAT
jgi:two-component system, cell cycle sensor histidine kinase and response regulator CckA